MSDESVLDLLQDPDGLRRMFAQPYDAEGPPDRAPAIDIPESSPLPSVDCNVEIRLRVRFDPWQIDRIPHEQLTAIVWTALTDPQYVGGIQPELTFVSMFLERTDSIERRRQSARSIAHEPQRPRDSDDGNDAGDHPARASEHRDADGGGDG